MYLTLVAKGLNTGDAAQSPDSQYSDTSANE